MPKKDDTDDEIFQLGFEGLIGTLETDPSGG